VKGAAKERRKRGRGGGGGGWAGKTTSDTHIVYSFAANRLSCCP